jgi:hypothetical protein
VPTSHAPLWKKLCTEAISAKAPSQKQIGPARRAILDRTIEIADTNATGTRERATLEQPSANSGKPKTEPAPEPARPNVSTMSEVLKSEVFDPQHTLRKLTSSTRPMR